MTELIAVCTAKKHTASGPKKNGGRWWNPDVYHLRRSGMTTYCGRDLTEWLTIGPIEKIDHNCCARCAKAVGLA